MERSLTNYQKRDVVIVPFPFTDQSTVKKRPALIIATYEEDVILLLITSTNPATRYASKITTEDFTHGSIHHTSYVKTNRIFTMDKKIIIKKIGSLNKDKTKEIEDQLITLIKQP